MVKVLTGGGYGSRKVSHVRETKREPIPKKVSVEAAAQIGRSEQFKSPNLEQGRGYEPGKVGSTGIAQVRQGHSGVGPGGGNRQIFKAGSQCPTPEPRSMPEGRTFDERPTKNRE
jgi:hypothetical protein